MGTEAIEKLYKNFSALADSKENITQHTKEYLEIIAAVKGTGKEKILASQFITRFFKFFPDLAHDAIDALLDLCEDEDVTIRKQAIKDLPSLCRDGKHYTQKIADILAQLLQAEDQGELSVVQNSLMTIFKQDAKGCLGGIFSQIMSGEDILREKCLTFLSNKIRTVGKDLLVKESEEFLISEAKKVLTDVNAQEFKLIMELLGHTRLGSTLSGQQELVDVVAEQIEIQSPFNPSPGEEVEFLDKIVNCVRHAIPYFSSQIPSTKFVAFALEQVLPQLDKLLAGSDEDTPLLLELFKVIAELTSNCGPLDDSDGKLTILYVRLLKYLPQPPPDIAELTQEPRLEFSYVECLMYAFHRLLRQHVEFISDADRLKDFKLRLQYFARGIQGYIKKLREALDGKSNEELKSEENKIKVVALKTTNNINILIKDLFHCPPSFKSNIHLSWKSAKVQSGTIKAPPPETGTKRYTPISFDDKSPGGAAKRAREIYQPPGGKFSNRISPGARRGGGSRGGFRGRGKYRGGRGFRRSF